jgi:hypothetical protein
MVRFLTPNILLPIALSAWLAGMLIDVLRPDAQALVELQAHRLACADAIRSGTPLLGTICDGRPLAYGVLRPEQVVPAAGADEMLASQP